MREAISRATLILRAVRGDTSSRNEKSDILASCLLVGGVLFRPLAIRYDVFPGHRGCDTPGSQKAPSAKRCIKTHLKTYVTRIVGSRQKAPSAKRCIKTCREARPPQPELLGHQKAPCTQNFARNSLLLALHQVLEIAEFQRSDFKRRNNRPGITCNLFTEPSVARTKRPIKTVSALNRRGYRCSLG